MKKFEIPEMNISMFDAESVTMVSSVTKARNALEATGEIDAIAETSWADMVQVTI